MITDLQTYCQKHYRWMFTVLLVIMIVPFIFAYGPGSRLSGSSHRNIFAKTNTFFGYDLSDKNQKEELVRLAEVSECLSPSGRVSADELAWKRIVKLALADHLGIPTPTTDQLTSYMGTLTVFQDKDGAFSQKKFSEFQEQLIRSGFSKDILTDAVIERWRLDQLSGALGGAVFFLPTTLERAYTFAHTKYSIEAFTLKAAVDTSLTVSEDEAKQFFAKNSTRYDMPEAREGIIYNLSADKFISQIPAPSESELHKFFDENNPSFVKWVEGDKQPKAPVFAEHRDEALKLYKQMKASRMAADVVDTVVSKLYSDKIVPRSQAWNDLIRASGIKEMSIKTGDPVADDSSLQALSMLSLSGKPYSEALQTDIDGRFILLTKIVPTHPQDYAVVAAQVKADALAAKRQSERVKALTAKVDALKKAFKSGKLDAEAAKAGFTVITPEPFIISEPAKVITSADLLESLMKAKVGDIISSVDSKQALVIALQEKIKPFFNPQGDKAHELNAQMEGYYKEMVELSYLNEYAQLHAK